MVMKNSSLVAGVRSRGGCDYSGEHEGFGGKWHNCSASDCGGGGGGSNLYMC